MVRLPYDKQYELAYQIYEALCAQHPDRFVALSDTRALLEAGCSGVNESPNERRQRAKFNGERVAFTAWINSRSNDGCFGCCAGHARSERR
jgi:hypothetical protein